MNRSNEKILGRISAALGLAVVIALAAAAPLGYFAASYQHTAGRLEAWAEITARSLSQDISRDPGIWRDGRAGMEAVLAHYPQPGNSAERIIDDNNRIVAEYGGPLEAPRITRSFPLVVSDRTLGVLEAKSSLRGPVMRTGIIALAGLFTVLALLFVFRERVLPLPRLLLPENHDKREIPERTLVADLADVNLQLTDEIHARKAALEQLFQEHEERKKTEDVIGESEEKNRLLFYDAPIGIFNYDARLRIIDCNNYFIDILRSSREELIGLDLETLKDKAVLPAIRRAIAGEEDLYEGLYRASTIPRGIWISLHTAPILGRNGKVKGGVGIVEDITERKSAEAELVQHERQATLSAEIGKALVQNRDLRSLLQLCAESMVNRLDAAFARIWTLNEKENVLELQASAGMYTHINGPHGRVPIGKFKIGLIALEKRPHLTNSVIGDPRIGDPEWAKREGMVAFAGHPLIVGGRLVGVMAMFAKKPLEETTLTTLASIADEIALGIERKQAEETLQKSEEQYRLLFKDNPNSMWVYDLETLSFLAVNDSAVQHYGYTKEAFLEMTIKDLHPSEDRGMVDHIVSNIRGDYRRIGIWRHQKSNGDVIDVEIVTYDIDFNGRKARLVLAEDVTMRLKAEQALYESESKLRAITDTALDAIVLIDEEERVVYWNPSAGKMLGYHHDEIMGTHIAAIIPARYKEAHLAGFRRFIEMGQGAKLGKTYEVFALKKDGTEIPIELSISGIRIKGRWHSAGIIGDISERKKLEAQLLHSQKMEAVGQLSGGVAHDFNNILSAIIGYGHILLLKMPGDDPLRLHVQHLLESADRAAHLTRNLLAFSRKQILNPSPVDLNEIIRRVGNILLRVIGEDIELKFSFKHGTVTVNADSGQIEQVLMNLATNARDAMPRGGSFTIETDTIELDQAFIRAHGYGKPGRYAIVSVSDSGTGMDEETRKKIFEPFFTTKEVGKGTGLGLSMVYGIVKQHRGYINVYSEQGKGTNFNIYLPLFDKQKEAGETATAIPEEQLPRGTETVLIAEDDEMLRALSRLMLEEFGYRVITAEDGEDAVRKFTEHQDSIRMVILDMIMPKKGGKETYEEIKKIKPGVKGLFVSGYTSDMMHLENTFGKRVELLMKPISPKVLVKKVREILDS